MKISHISTGNKLKYKTFGELKPGDTVYWTYSEDETIEDTMYTVVDTINKYISANDCFTDLNPDKKVYTDFDIKVKCKNKNGEEDDFMAPSNATYLVRFDVVITTDKELLLSTIKKYNLETHLV